MYKFIDSGRDHIYSLFNLKIMSNSKSNAITRNYKGKFGDQIIFRNRNGKSIMCLPPEKSSSQPSDSQLAIRQRFRLASRYAKNVLLNPDMNALYATRAVNGMTPYLVAMTDHLRPPYVSEINTCDYTGNPGDKIHVAADDDFAVTEVTVSIFDAQGIEIEKGTCVQDSITSYYDYTATVSVANLTGVEIIAKARDYPGHVGDHFVTL